MSDQVKRKVGRPRKSELYGGHIRAAEDQIADRLPELVENMLALARGVWVEENDKDGQRFVYQRPPDRGANEYLINRIMGKPTDVQEVSGPDGEAVQAMFIRVNNPRDEGIRPSAEAD